MIREIALELVKLAFTAQRPGVVKKRPGVELHYSLVEGEPYPVRNVVTALESIAAAFEDKGGDIATALSDIASSLDKIQYQLDYMRRGIKDAG